MSKNMLVLKMCGCSLLTVLKMCVYAKLWVLIRYSECVGIQNLGYHNLKVLKIC